MSEHLLNKNPELSNGHEQVESQPSGKQEKNHSRVEATGEHQADQSLENIRHKIEEAVKKQEQPPAKTGDELSSQPKMPTYVNYELRLAALRRSLKHIQRDLPATWRVFSKVTHQPGVKSASELTGKTVARPSGLLGGGICAFGGSLFLLYLSKHVGFSYNYFWFILCFLGGFVLGSALELLGFVLRRKKHSAI